MEVGFFWRGHPLETSLQGRIWLRKSEACEELVEGGSARVGGQAKSGASLSCLRTFADTLLVWSGLYCDQDGLAKKRREGKPHLGRPW